MLLSGLMALGGGVARADAINIDFNRGDSPTYSGVGAAPDTGTFWNGVTGQGASNLKNSAGTTTRVGVIANFAGSLDQPGGLGANNNNASGLLRDFIFISNTAPVTLVGLTPGATYDLYLYGVGIGGSGAPARTAFTINGQTQFTNGPNSGTNSLTAGEDYVVFTGVQTSADAGFGGAQTISIFYGPRPGDSFGVFNGLQVQSSSAFLAPVATPEPETWAMLLMGVAACALWQRKRRVVEQ